MNLRNSGLAQLTHSFSHSSSLYVVDFMSVFEYDDALSLSM